MTPKKRRIIIRIDDLAEILKDYLDPNDLPANARPVEFAVNPADRGRIGVRFISPDWQGDLGVQLVDAQLKRYYGVGRN